MARVAPNAVYQWDGEQRLVGIVLGTNQTRFFYDGSGHRVRIVETSGGELWADYLKVETSLNGCG